MKHGILAAVIAAGALAGAPIASADLVGFISPTGNIGCMMDEDFVRCDIAERDWAPPPRPADCPDFTGYGQGIELPADGQPRFVCAGDTALFGGPPLDYGRTQSSRHLSCESTPSGVTCTNEDQHGFTLSRQAYRLF